MSVEDKLGITKTVYSWVMPETEKVVKNINSKDDQTILQKRHQEAWTGKQDEYHKEFFDAWIDWSSGKISGMSSFPYRYPAAGSSEAIRESIAQHASIANYKPHLGVPTIHVFEGEYEGYKALAKPYGVRVVEHKRTSWAGSILNFVNNNKTEGHKWYISQPSSIDGNFWLDIDRFLDYISDNTGIDVMLDLCYLGCVPNHRYPVDGIDTEHEAIDTIFFSLSKVFGVYYHRIGGMFSKTEHPGLWGNKWFKNLNSLYLGTKLMREFGITELPDRYFELQRNVVDELSDSKLLMGIDHIKASDVFLLAHQYRGHLRDEFNRTPLQKRYCLTRRFYEICKEAGRYLDGKNLENTSKINRKDR